MIQSIDNWQAYREGGLWLYAAGGFELSSLDFSSYRISFVAALCVVCAGVQTQHGFVRSASSVRAPAWRARAFPSRGESPRCALLLVT